MRYNIPFYFILLLFQHQWHQKEVELQLHQELMCNQGNQLLNIQLTSSCIRSMLKGLWY